MRVRVFTAFSGYDSQCLALDRIKRDYPDFDYELVGWSEIDKYAIQAHDALYPQWADRNYGDISKIDWSQVPDFDLFTYSSPCQDFSNAGLQKGGTEGSGTRSSLLWECRRAIVAKRPKYLLLENVAALVSQKFLPLFNKWQAELASYGYTNFAQVLNAKDYGVPQNRERVFLVSILNGDSYHFPKPFKLEKRLKDVLESNVDEKYYLSDKMIDFFTHNAEKQKEKGNGFSFNVTDGNVIAKTITTRAGSRMDDNFIGNRSLKETLEQNEIDDICYIDTYNRRIDKEKSGTITTGVSFRNNTFLAIKNATKKGYLEATDGDGIDLLQPNSETRRGRVQKEAIQTLDTMGGDGKGVVLNDLRIRKLTPKECFRLMGVKDEDFEKCAKSQSDSSLYHLAGDSLITTIMMALFSQMLDINWQKHFNSKEWWNNE